VTGPLEPFVFEDSELRRSILKNLPNGLCIIDMQKKISRCVQSAEKPLDAITTNSFTRG
jgi:hypothetical protein